MNKDYQIVVVSSGTPNAPYFCLDAFYKSLAGETILLLGQNFPNFHLSDRPRILHDAIKNGAVSTEYIIFCDSWDLFFVDKPEVIIEKHLANNCDITISAEKNCFPDDYREHFDKVAPKDTSYKYLNCGTVIGRTDAFFALLESMDAANQPYDYFDQEKGGMFHYNEQKYYHEEFVKQKLNIKLDYYQDIANCMQDVLPEELDFSGEKIRNIECNTYPSIIHMNGNSKDAHGIRELTLKHYGYL